MIRIIEKIALLRFKFRIFISTLKWKLLIKDMGRDVSIAQRCSFTRPSLVKMGNRIFINSDCKFILHDEGITINDYVAIGPGCTFITANTDYSEWKVPMAIRDKKISKPIVIEEDVWIGASVIILPGVTVSRGAIVAAGAVVTKNVPSYSIVGWVPAKVIGWRFDKETIDKASRISFKNIEEKYDISNNYATRNLKRLNLN